MKKILALSALSFSLLACSDNSSSSPSTDPAAGLYGEWNTTLTIPSIFSEISFDMNLNLQENKTLILDLDGTMGDTPFTGTATGTWSFRNDSLTILPTSCPTELQLACAMFREDTPLPVKNLTESSWESEFPMGNEPILIEFTRP